MKEILLVIVALVITIVLLCLRIIIMKDGRFSSQHISENKRMREDGIHCATSQDREARKNKATKIDVRQM
jgi:hypothetical protein